MCGVGVDNAIRTCGSFCALARDAPRQVMKLTRVAIINFAGFKFTSIDAYRNEVV
jgi:hypothetical protein